MKFLDCTLRDGGYYNQWDFDLNKANQLVRALNNAGADIIELGYKAPPHESKYLGLFRYCNEHYLSFLHKSDPSEYAFMVDVKQFIRAGRIDKGLLDSLIKPAEKSIFTWVRLASHYNTIRFIPSFTKYFRDKGYNVTFNLMGGSLLSKSQISEGLTESTKAEVDVFYLADSFGSFYPDDIVQLVKFVKKNYKGKVGIHTHDNQGMAYANTLAALDEGVDFVDGTITGMGRGAGNLLTEQFLTGYKFKNPDCNYNGNALLKIIEEYIEPMKKKYNWGYNPTYMYSGLQNIHPSYCQQLIESHRYTFEEISGILSNISVDERANFNIGSLEKAIQKLLKSELEEEEHANISHFDLDLIQSDSVIIVARGDEAGKHMDSILSLSKRKNIRLVECNDTGFFDDNEERIITILNQLRLNNWMQKSHKHNKTTLISGFPARLNGLKGGYFPFTIGAFDISQEKISIPDYDAGLYAIALALKSGIKNIMLAGFDGFKDEKLNKIKEIYFQQIKEYENSSDTKIIHITPTNYSVFKEQSLYTY